MEQGLRNPLDAKSSGGEGRSILKGARDGASASSGLTSWPMPGQTGATLHEGLSLVECLVPMLRVLTS
jgi:hypothetical protein